MVHDETIVAYTCTDEIATIELNRPHRLNAVTPELVEALCGALERAIADEARVTILSGRGRAFCVGYDLKAGSTHADEVAHRRHLDRVNDVTRLARRAPFVLVAAIHGYALGNGIEFALAADVVIAAEGTFLGFPEVSWGLSVTGGITQLLVNAAGAYRAKSLLFFGEKFDARQAEKWGLVTHVVMPDQVQAEACRVAAVLAQKPRAALLRAKRAIDVVSSRDLEMAMALEAEHALAARRSEESAKAIEAFGSAH